MRFQLNYLFSVNAPNVDRTILTTWHNIFCVRSKWALDDGWLVEETCQVILFVTIKGIQKHDHIIGGCYEKEVAAVAKLHNLYLAIFLKLPVTKRTSLTLLRAKKAKTRIRLFSWHFAPSSCKNQATWVITSNRVSSTVLLLHVKNEKTLLRFRGQTPYS